LHNTGFDEHAALTGRHVTKPSPLSHIKKSIMKNQASISKSNLIRSLLLLTIILLCGCGSLHKKINEILPRKTSFDIRMTSLVHESVKLNQFDKIDGILHLREKEFSNLFELAYQKNKGKIESMQIDEIDNMKLDLRAVSLVNQGIDFSFNFGFNISEYNIPLNGFANGISILNIDEENINISVALTSLKLEPISKKDENKLIKRLGLNGAVSLINNLLKQYISNVNHHFLKDPLSIPIDLNFVKEIDLNKVVDSKTSVISENGITAEVALNTLIPYLHDDGFGILINSKRMTIGNLENEKENISEEEFNSAFIEYQNKVEQKLRTSLNLNLNEVHSNTFFFLSKAFVAQIFNKTLQNINVKVEMRDFIDIPEEKSSFESEIRLHDRQNLPSCSGLRKPFDGYDCGECNQESCDGPCNKKKCPSCKWYQADCLAERALCEAENKLREAGCVACKTAKASEKAACDVRLSACKLERERRRVFHQAENEARVAECETNKLALKFVDGVLKLAELKGQAKALESQANFKIKNIQLSADLSEVSISSDFNASAKSWIRVWVNPESLGHIACIFSFRKTLENIISYKEENKTIKVSLKPQTSDDKLTLIATTKQETLNLKLRPIPYVQLVEDPGFVLNCSFLSIAMPLFTGAQILREKDIPEYLEAIMFGKVKLEVKSNSFELPINSVKIGENGSEYIFLPAMKDNYIGFYKK